MLKYDILFPLSASSARKEVKCSGFNNFRIICYGKCSRKLHKQVVRQIQVRQVTQKESPESGSSQGFPAFMREMQSGNNFRV